MNAASIVDAIEAVVLGAVAVVCLISTGMTARTRMRTEAGHAAADAALKAAEQAHEESARKLTEARQLADRLREHREWIDSHPEEFRAALLAQLTATDQ